MKQTSRVPVRATSLVAALIAALIPVHIAVLAASGCVPKESLPEVAGLTPEKARLRLEREGMRRQRMTALVRARMTGLEGLLTSADIDVVLEAPARVHLSLRSFFEQPLYVLATDGVRVTIFDATAAAGPVFLTGPADGAALGALFGTEIWPQEAVALFLGIAPAPGAEPVRLDIDRRTGTYTLSLREPRGRLSVVTARLDDDALVSWTAYGDDGETLFRMRYLDLRAEGDVPFPHRWELRVRTPEGERGLSFDAKDLELNGPPLPAEVFLLQPPPGVPVRSLARLDGAGRDHTGRAAP